MMKEMVVFLFDKFERYYIKVLNSVKSLFGAYIYIFAYIATNRLFNLQIVIDNNK